MAAQDSGTVAVLAEKPSVARDIASMLGATSKRDGYWHGHGYVVTWAIGHLAALAQPHEIDPAWRQWRRDLLPMLPEHWPLVVYEKTKDQFEVVRKIVNSPRISRVICATDAGREGELIAPREPATLDWDRFTWPEAIARFARGLGAAHLGKVSEARAAGERLEELKAATRKAGEELFARNIRVLRLELNAWIAHVAGQKAASVALMREDAELEASTPKHPVTPAPTLSPPNELLGACS